MIPIVASILSSNIIASVAFPSSSTSLGVTGLEEVADALDNAIRADLQGLSQEMFVWVIRSTEVLAAGCFLELPELVFDIWPKRFSWFTWKSQIHHVKFENTVKIIGLVGWFLVAGGIIGEGVFESLQNHAEGQLQTFNDTLLTEARLSASRAAESAKIAHSESDAATIASGVAQALAQSARNEADSFQDAIKSAQSSAADANEKAASAESHLAEALERALKAEKELKEFRAFRNLSSDQEAAISKAMGNFDKKLRVDVFCTPFNAECEKFGGQLIRVLNKPFPGARAFQGDTIVLMTGAQTVSDVVVFTTQHREAKDVGTTLTKMLSDDGISATTIASMGYPDPMIMIAIGNKK